MGHAGRGDAFPSWLQSRWLEGLQPGCRSQVEGQTLAAVRSEEKGGWDRAGSSWFGGLLKRSRIQKLELRTDLPLESRRGQEWRQLGTERLASDSRPGSQSGVAAEPGALLPSQAVAPWRHLLHAAPGIHAHWASAAEEIQRADELLAVPTEGHAFSPQRPSWLLEERIPVWVPRTPGAMTLGPWARQPTGARAAHHHEARLQSPLFLLLRLQTSPV